MAAPSALPDVSCSRMSKQRASKEDEEEQELSAWPRRKWAKGGALFSCSITSFLLAV